MMNIFIVNDGEITLVAYVNEDNKVITHERYVTLARLMDDDFNIDRKTIADLCDMTEEEFNRYYSGTNIHQEKINGHWTLTEAFFELRTEEEIKAYDRFMLQDKLDKFIRYEEKAMDEVFTVGDCCDMWKINRACEYMFMPNPIAHMNDVPIVEIDTITVNRIISMRNMMKHNDESDDYGDILIEAIIELNSLLEYL